LSTSSSRTGEWVLPPPHALQLLLPPAKGGIGGIGSSVGDDHAAAAFAADRIGDAEASSRQRLGEEKSGEGGGRDAGEGEDGCALDGIEGGGDSIGLRYDASRSCSERLRPRLPLPPLLRATIGVPKLSSAIWIAFERRDEGPRPVVRGVVVAKSASDRSIF
jgi:hypothetical protein